MTSYLSFESCALLGQDEAYRRWYDDVHIPEVLKVPGFKRLLLRCRVVGDEPQPRYVSIFEVDGDPKAALGALQAAVPAMQMTDTLDREKTRIESLESV